MPRLRRADPAKPGWTRRRCGRGFVFLDQHGQRVDASGPNAVGTWSSPAWAEVWICPWPNGHIKLSALTRRAAASTCTTRTGAPRDREKFDHIVAFGQSLPAARTLVAEHLQLPGMPFERALATGFRLLDLGGLRVGSEDYAQDNGSFGLATLRCDHVSTRGGTVRLRFTGKSGKNTMSSSMIRSC